MDMSFINSINQFIVMLEGAYKDRAMSEIWKLWVEQEEEKRLLNNNPGGKVLKNELDDAVRKAMHEQLKLINQLSELPVDDKKSVLSFIQKQCKKEGVQTTNYEMNLLFKEKEKY